MGAGALIALAILTASGARASDDPTATTTRDFAFVSAGRTLSGIISEPIHTQARALLVFVHGYGKTDVRGWDMYADLRSRFAELGITTVTWDKPGQGRSEGTFDINQPVDSSAQEVLDAVAHLRSQRVPGVGKLGLWGISRAGWIAPLALSRDPDITFWISVSGVTAEENFFHFLKSNLPYEGSTFAEAEALMQERKHGWDILRAGGSYDDYLAATKNFWANAFIGRMLGPVYSRDTYEAEQAWLRESGDRAPIDMETGLALYIQDFPTLLSRLDIDVLALFGEKDLNVDWRRTRALYASTLGANRHATLTVTTFPDGNHNIDVCETGSMREMQTMMRKSKSDGYYEAQVAWLNTHVLRPTSSGDQRQTQQ